MKGIIFNIFLYQSKSSNDKIYLYSKKNQLNDLGYEYHILGPNKNNELVDKQIPNIIQIFENNDISNDIEHFFSFFYRKVLHFKNNIFHCSIYVCDWGALIAK